MDCNADEDGGISMEEMLLIHEMLLEDFEEGVQQSANQTEATSENQTQQSPMNLCGTKRKKPELPLHQRAKMITKLLVATNDKGELRRGAQSQIAQQFGVDKSTVSRIWSIASEQRKENGYLDAHSNKVGNCGRKAKVFDEEWLQFVPLNTITTIRSFTRALNVSPSTVYSLLKRGYLRSHSSPTHPKLSEKQKIARIKWVLSQIIPRSWTEPAQFLDMHNEVHIDEKCFILNPENPKFYLVPREEDPYRCVVSKKFSLKVMFMAAIARPVFDEDGEVLWDGKIGIFPFVYEAAAIRSSKNREKGTLELKPILSVTKDVVRRMLIDNVLPAIRRLWPPFLPKDIIIQQDNARPHIQPNDPEFLQAATLDGFNIRLVCQPAQSPDLNVLDLGFFRAIQSLCYQSFPKDVKELIERVEEAYIFYDPMFVNFGWLQLQYVMVQILEKKGGNNFRIPHNNKQKMDKEGVLPDNVEVEQSLIDGVVKILNEGIVAEPNPHDVEFNDVDFD